ncbi:MAG: hypothetical protein ABSB59_32530 [Streptosporangiaceae bacterium]|jgi:hypothetical protein
MLDYLETGLFRGHPAPARGGPGTARDRRLRASGSGVRRLAADRRFLAAVAIAAVALAVLVGTSLPLRSTQASPGRPPVTAGIAPRSPSASAASPSSATPGSSSASLPAGSTASPRGTRPGAARSPGAGAGGVTSPATVRATASARPAARATATRRATKPARATSAVVVTFSVTSEGGGFFEGQVQIVNDGTKPLAGWQVSVALPGDRVVAVARATGFVIHGILLLDPASGAAPVPPGGGVLDVVFVAVGSPPLPGACTYNQTPCA